MDEINKLLQLIKKELFGEKANLYRSSNRNSKTKTGRYWVYSFDNDIPIGKVCNECRKSEKIIEEHYKKKLVDELYITNRRNHDKCDICGKNE